MGVLCIFMDMIGVAIPLSGYASPNQRKELLPGYLASILRISIVLFGEMAPKLEVVFVALQEQILLEV